MKTSTLRISQMIQRGWRSTNKFLVVPTVFALTAVAAQAQTPVFTNVWILPAGTYADLPSNTGNNVRGIAINPLTTNVLYASTAGGTNSGANHVATLAFASGSNYLANLSGSGITAGTLALEGVRVADDGAVYACNLSSAPASDFKIYRWPSDSDMTTAPTVVYDSGPATSFQWRLGDYMDLRGSGSNTEIVVVGNGSGANISTNFVIFRPTDNTAMAFTNFSITIPAGLLNVCGAGVAFEGTNNAIWVRRASSQETRRVAYNPATLTAMITATNTVDQSVCQGLKYYSANGINLLATVQATSSSISPNIARVFQIPTNPFAAFVSVLTSNLPPPYAANGNALGTVDAKNGYFIFGAPGNGLLFLQLGFALNSPPSSTASASASTIIAGFGLTNTVTASGSTPLRYQWYFNTNTLIVGATNNIYAIPSVQMTNVGVYSVIVTNLYGSSTNYLSTVTVLPNATSSLMTQLWSIPPGTRDYVSTGDTQRGMAFDPIMQRLVVVSRSSTNGVHLLDANTGADVGQLDMTALNAVTPSGTFAINMCGVADDGVVYVGNLLTSTTSDNFVIYSWTAATSTATINQAYGGQPGIARIGDTMAVRGAGVNTEILCSFRSGTNIALFTTTDGVNFNLNVIAVTNLQASAQANGFAGLGIAFGPGNTFWTKSTGFEFRQIAFDLTSGIGTMIQDLPSVASSESAIGVDNANGYLAAIGVGETPQNLGIYDLSTSGGPSLVDREFFPANNANGNGTGAVAFDVAGGRVFSLDSNSGIIALSYAGKLSITQTGGSQVVTWPVATAILQSSTNVAGPYVDVSGATSPYTNSLGAVQFFRLRH